MAFNRAEWGRKYREKNKDKIKEYQKLNRNKIRERTRRYDALRRKTKEWKEYHRDYYKQHKEYFKEYMQILHEKQKKIIFEHYGKRCEICGQNNEKFLTIDHINGGGNKHRKNTNGNMYYWLIKHNFPSGFRILCYNCNCSMTKKFNKGRYKNIRNTSYHQKARESSKQHREKERKQVFDYYGYVCANCGETTNEFLTIDHINGGGCNHIKNIIHGHFYKWLIKNNFPNDFQTLCYNCNCSKGKKFE